MIHTLAISGYRSIRDLALPLGRLNLVTGANGSGKSNLYRGLRLLCDVAQGDAVQALAQEGGLESVLWAGPEAFAAGMTQGQRPVEGGRRRQPVALKLGFATDSYGYSIEFGLPIPVPRTLFGRDPEIKREAIWHGGSWHERRALVDRKGPVVRVRDDSGAWQVIDHHLATFDSMLTRLADPSIAPEALLLREQLRAWRFYDHFRCDPGSPARVAQVAVRTPALSNDGHDLPAAWRTIAEIGDSEALSAAVTDAFPGAEVVIESQAGRFELLFRQPGLLRPLGQAELSDGTLRYLLLIAALLTPRPPPLMVLNEPESSLHPDLLGPLGRLMRAYAQANQLWVVSHAPALQDVLARDPAINHIRLDKELSETFVHDQDLFSAPRWRWPGR
ncbi:MAG: AAA family ATPase [Pseudomonadales bacterium]